MGWKVQAKLVDVEGEVVFSYVPTTFILERNARKHARKLANGFSGGPPWCRVDVKEE